jgi:hypothetical protein
MFFPHPAPQGVGEQGAATVAIFNCKYLLNINGQTTDHVYSTQIKTNHLSLKQQQDQCITSINRNLHFLHWKLNSVETFISY